MSNFDGSSGELAGGGIIQGDIEITGSGQIDGNLDVGGDINCDTLTANTIISVEEIKVADSIISMGVGNPADVLNLGILEEHTAGGKRWGGLLRSKDDKKQYLIEGATAEPTPTTDITTLPRANLVLQGVETATLNIGEGAAKYALPTAQGTSGQVLTADGLGQTAWEDAASSNPFDQSLNTTDDVDFNQVTSATTLVCQNTTGLAKISTTGFNSQQRSQNAVGGVGYVSRRSRGEIAAPLTVLDNDGIQETYHTAYDGTTYDDAVRMITKADGTWTPTNHGITYTIETIVADSTEIEERLRIDGEGTTLSGQVNLTTAAFPAGAVVSSLGTPILTDTAQGLTIKHSGVGLPQIQLNSTASTVSDSSGLTFASMDNFNMTLQSSEIIVQAPSGDADFRIARQDLPNSGLIAFNNLGGRGTVWQFGTQAGTDNLSISDAAGEGSVWEFDAGLQKSLFSSDVDMTGDVKVGSSLRISDAYTMPTVNGGLAQYLAPNATGFASWETLPQPSYGEQFFNGNVAPTVITTQNVWVDVVGTRVAGNLLDFTAGAAAMTYTGTPKSFQTSVSLTWQIDDGKAQEFEIGFFKNGGLVPEGVMRGSLDDNNTFPRNVSSVCILPLAATDTVTVKIRNIVGTSDVIIISMSFVLVSIAGATSTNNGAQVTPTLQEVFSISNAPQIATEASPLVLKSPIVVTRDVLVIENTGGVKNFSVTGAGKVLGTAVETISATVFNGLALGEEEFQYTMPPGSTGAVDGDIIAYNAANLGFEFKRPAVKAGWSSVSRLDQRTISNNVLELQLTDGMTGLTLPANTVKAGDTYLITSTGNASAFDIFQSVIFRLKLGGPLGSLIADGFPQAAGWTNTLQYYKYEVMVCFRSVGSAAALSCVVSSNFGRNATYSSSINTTVNQDWALTFAWQSLDPLNVLQQEQLTIRKIC